MLRDRTLAAGTAIAAKFDSRISSRTHKAGQQITESLLPRRIRGLRAG